MMKTELLAPAGNFACFRAAVNAGADAVYLGGEKFGARAYADNFSQEELINAIHIAHIFGRKIYLTVNTLIKEKELSELVPYVLPFYEAGLDGVIVQDIGVLDTLRSHFPQLALHASTQMAVTGSYGAAFVKKLGVCRVVPARELSLEEIKAVKKETGLEIECFVHGSMCYAYSGQCLFSSVLGGRSGNRGCCAGPCRLPYTDEKGRTCYPLSLRDMYTLSILPDLIDAGIDSFKIEGRMKSPEYVAGVTAMYRKYIDLYTKNPHQPYHVDPADEKMLKELYIRSDLCDGYYKRHNGKEMVTLRNPGYSGSAQETIDDIRERYLSKDIRLPVTGYARIYAGEQSAFTLSCKNGSMENTSVTVTGDMVSAAVNRPLDGAEISKRLGKMGDTCFELASLSIDTDLSSFMTVKSLNDLRRLACTRLEEALVSNTIPQQKQAQPLKQEQKVRNIDRAHHTAPVNAFCALAATIEQLNVIQDFPDIRYVYVNADILLQGHLTVTDLLRHPDSPDTNTEYFLVLPHIFRQRSYRYEAAYEKLLNEKFLNEKLLKKQTGQTVFKGVLVRSYEELEWLQKIDYHGAVVSDHTVYAWNNAAISLLEKQVDRITLPLELNRQELNMLEPANGVEFVVYGYIPLMYSANCIRNTLEKCVSPKKDPDLTGTPAVYHLTDRYKNVFPVVQNCMHCYNVLYNTVPLSLHGQMANIAKKGYNLLRLDFSIEDSVQTRRVIEHFLKNAQFPYQAYTNGHYKRGV